VIPTRQFRGGCPPAFQILIYYPQIPHLSVPQIFTPPKVSLRFEMGLGVLDDKNLEHVPGTAPLAEVLAARNLENLHDGTPPPSTPIP
jgi:hypothetical protein